MIKWIVAFSISDPDGDMVILYYCYYLVDTEIIIIKFYILQDLFKMNNRACKF